MPQSASSQSNKDFKIRSASSVLERKPSEVILAIEEKRIRKIKNNNYFTDEEWDESERNR